MAGVDYTTDGLIASIKRRISLPDAQNLYSSTDLISFMGDELSSTIIPLVHSIQQEYWVMKQDVPLVNSQTVYTLPVRGIMNGLRLLTLVDPSGNEIEFPRLQPENIASTYNWLSPYTTSTLYGFYFEDDHTVMFPQQLVSNPTMTVRFRFERAPNQLAATADSAQITVIAGNVVTVNAVPSIFTTSLTYDIIKGQPGFVSRGDDQAITNINSGASQITFTALPSTVAVGDWISVSGTSPIPQIPYQMFPYLAQAVATKCLEGLGYVDTYTIALQRLNQMKEDLLKVLQPRDLGNVQTVLNRGGLFDSGQFWGWSGGIYWAILLSILTFSSISGIILPS